MKFLNGLSRRLLPVPLILWPALAFPCDSLPSGQTLWVRLTSPVSTYTAKPGDPVVAVLTEAIECDNEVIFPIGTSVNGVVRSVRKVGWGIHHETAALDVAFERAMPAAGAAVPLQATVVEVENAREQVNTKGIIEGIRSSDTPQGRINSRLRHLPTWNPYSDVGLIVFKASFPIFPEPEIYLPAGTDIRLRLTQPVTSLTGTSSLTAVNNADDTAILEVEDEANTLPIWSTTPALSDADVINVAFLGSHEQVEAAFTNAGWVNSEVFTKHSFMRDFYAFLNNSGYPEAPMRPLLLDGKPADMNWEKSLNSYARRDHLRMWQWTSPSGGETLWLSSSTHDQGAALSVKRHEFLHHITPDIDDERSKVVRDLTAAGCVQSVHFVSRRDVPNLTQNATGDPVRTDGELAIIELKSCQPATPELASVPQAANFKAGNHAFRYFRRQILTFRSDIWRANIIYGVYDLGHMSVTALRHRHPAPLTYPEANEVRLQQARQQPPHHADMPVEMFD